MYDNDLNNWCGRPSPLPMTPVNAANRSQQEFGPVSRQQPHRRRPPHQLQPQPLEPPPPPPALSVAFTAVACPWWTVLEGKQTQILYYNEHVLEIQFYKIVFLFITIYS